jgi:ADP-ribose pyrophosphatase YjhB (NUDIX family)
MNEPARTPIRVVAIGVFSRGSRILVNEGRDPVSGFAFVRPLGGRVEFGETGAQAVIREAREEVGARVCDVSYLGTLENLFTWAGKPQHEVVLVYEAKFVDDRLYDRPYLEGRETDGELIRASWRELGEIAQCLVPSGLHALLVAKPSRAEV